LGGFRLGRRRQNVRVVLVAKHLDKLLRCHSVIITSDWVKSVSVVGYDRCDDRRLSQLIVRCSEPRTALGVVRRRVARV
jgi:hypothetical protein